MLADGWSVVDAQDGFLLLRQAEGPTTIPAAFYSFAQPDAEPLPAPAAADWPRWRQTRLLADWPTTAPEPTLSVLTPAGETLYTLGTATPPALLWRAQGVAAGTLAADTPLHAETPWLWLPRTVLAHTGETANGTVFRRTRAGELRSLPAGALEADDYTQAIQALTAFRLNTAQVQIPGAQPLDVTLVTEQRTLWPGDTLDVWLQWRGDGWPVDAPPRLELHHAGFPVAADEGPPRLFGREQTARLSTQGVANDWRTVTLPADLPASDGWALHLVAADGRPLLTIPLTRAPGRRRPSLRPARARCLRLAARVIPVVAP